MKLSGHPLNNKLFSKVNIMSFGNRSSYCSLRDAFTIKTPVFDESKIMANEQHTIDYHVIQEPPVEEKNATIKETFEDSRELDVCEKYQEHCSECKKCGVSMVKTYGPIGTGLNEILNLILIFILLWIIVYKPSL